VSPHAVPDGAGQPLRVPRPRLEFGDELNGLLIRCVGILDRVLGDLV